jgi:nucleotide-binding universal stress UspA family protein
MERAMFHHILVGVDDSSACRKALARAIELAQAGHGRLGLLASAPTPAPIASIGPSIAPVSSRELAQQSLDWAQRNLDAATELVPGDLPVTKLIARGAAGRALLRQARTGCWDLIVVGQTHRRPRLPLLERVGDRLNRRSPIPVLVVHQEPDQPRPGFRARLDRILRRRAYGAVTGSPSIASN